MYQVDGLSSRRETTALVRPSDVADHKPWPHVHRLFLRELGIDFEDKRYAYDSTWAPLSEEFKQKGLTVTQKLPSLLIDGHTLSQHTAILRYLSRSVGAYDGTSNYEKWLVDAVSDVYVDWRVRYFFHSVLGSLPFHAIITNTLNL